MRGTTANWGLVVYFGKCQWLHFQGHVAVFHHGWHVPALETAGCSVRSPTSPNDKATLDFAREVKAIDRIRHSLMGILSHEVCDREIGRFLLSLVVLAYLIVTSHDVISCRVYYCFLFYYTNYF